MACEGASDAGLIPHIQRLIMDSGRPQAEGESWFYGNPLEKKIRTGLQVAENTVDVLFVHRDANSAGAEERLREIANAVGRVTDGTWVGVVPVRMTEAWLLLDEVAIRTAVGRPHGRTPLHLLTPREAERRADPKRILADAFLAASDATGRRRQRIERDFSRLRRRLLEGLPIHGPLVQLKFLEEISRRHTPCHGRPGRVKPLETLPQRRRSSS